MTIYDSHCDIDFTLDFFHSRRKKCHFHSDHVALQLVVGLIDAECWFLLTISNFYIDFSSLVDLLPKLFLRANVIKSSFLWLMLSVSYSVRDKNIRCDSLSHGRLFELAQKVVDRWMCVLYFERIKLFQFIIENYSNIK